jgi:hypothetical protein
MKGTGFSILIVVLAVFALWVISVLLGFRISLLSSLLLSVGLTLVVNLGMRAFRRSSSRA